MAKKWFKKAVKSSGAKSLGCWQKNKSAKARRRCAMASRASNWKLHTKYLSCARALQALANVTKDRPTKRAAKADANYFFKKAKKSGS